MILAKQWKIPVRVVKFLAKHSKKSDVLETVYYAKATEQECENWKPFIENCALLLEP